MFGSKKKQYVAITKQDKQLKLNYKILQDDNILKEEHSSFLITNQAIPGDALFKLDALQKDILSTYLATLFEGETQKVVKKEEVDVISYESINLNESMSIVIPKNEVVSTSRYFSNSGIDYIFSPFSILHEYIKDLGVKNSLNVFVLNSTIYTVLLGEYKEIVRADTKELTPFDEIKDEDFSDDEIVDQKLYEEVHFLEIQQFLNDIVQEYYSSSDDIDFLEEIKVLYTLQSFSKEQLDSLYETLMVTINYEQLDLQLYFSRLFTSENAINHSFIDPRVKKEKSSFMGWLFLIILSFIAILLVVYFNLSEPTSESEVKSEQIEKKQPVQTVEVKQELQEIKKVILPNLPEHTTPNINIKEHVAMLFDIIPYDGVLKDIEVFKESSTYVVNFAMPSTSVEDMQTKLKNIYEESKVLLTHQNKAILNAIIENDKITTKQEDMMLKEYPKLEFMPLAKATEYIKSLAIENSIIKLETKGKQDYQTYTFNLVSNIQSPMEFFEFIEKLNNQSNSIIVNYPIVFSKLNESIEVKFNLDFYQEKQAEPKLKN